MRIGLLFGSFNPIHIGHLIIADTMLGEPEIDSVWFVVSPHNPHKKKNQLLHEFDRLDMVRLAIADNPCFDVSDIEFRLPQPNYTIDTLTYLSAKYPQHKFQLIIGGDNLSTFHKWKNYTLILEDYGLLVYPRPNTVPTPIYEHPKVKVVNMPLLDISATFIREAIKNGKSVRYLLPPEVASFIKYKKFYQ
jgi:nicotinate-nucleotide adenylyltransferase